MYLTQVHITHIRCIRELKWELDPGQAAGWHVVIGDNAAGKSTFLSAIALALVGPPLAEALRQDWGDWLTRGTDSATIRVGVAWNAADDGFVGKGDHPGKEVLPVAVGLQRTNGDVGLKKVASGYDPTRSVWGSGHGWFGAGFGPFRRFWGGDRDYDVLFHSKPRLARYLSLFDEGVALSACVDWLEELDTRRLNGDEDAGHLLEDVKRFVNQPGFLPAGIRLADVSSNGIKFREEHGCDVWLYDLSDGFRSVLSVALELIRLLTASFGRTFFAGKDPITVHVPGVVLIDEIDAHLHPAWQRTIGPWFLRYFPRMQFIVTTHSPLICQAATRGTIWKIEAAAGGGSEIRRLQGSELERLLYGDILEAYSTEAFGATVTRSESGRERLQRLAELNRKELTGGLNAKERSEQDRLRASLPLEAHRA